MCCDVQHALAANLGVFRDYQKVSRVRLACQLVAASKRGAVESSERAVRNVSYLCGELHNNSTITVTMKCFGADSSWLVLQQTRRELSGAQRLNDRRLHVDVEH